MTVNVYVRLLVLAGMPVIAPVDEFRVNPVGKAGDPPASPHVYEPVPPVAASVAL